MVASALSWQTLGRKLRVGKELRAWSRDKGYTESRFRIQDIDAASISINSSGLSKVRRISKSDFEKIAAVWGHYCAGKISRGEMAKLSQNTSYIFGIFKSLEENE